MPGRSIAATLLEAKPELRKELRESDVFQTLQAKLKRVKLDDEELFVAEGDTLLDEDQLMIYAQQRKALDEIKRAADGAKAAGLGTLRLVGTTDLGAQSRG